MGTSVNDIDIGIRVGTTDEDVRNAQQAGDAVEHFTATAEQSREALARAGGDFTKFKQILLELVTAQKAASVGATQQAQAQQSATAATQRQATANTAAAGAAAQNATAQRQVAQATQQVAQAASGAAQNVTQIVQPANAAVVAISKIPAGARTAANALSIISSNAINGTGSLSSFANSAGAAAFGLSQLSGSATLAASAAGIGAVVTVVGVLIGLFETFESRRKALSKGLGDLSRDISGIGVDALKNRLDATDASIRRLNDQRNAIEPPGQNVANAIRATARPFGDNPRELDKIDDEIKNKLEQRAKLREALTAAEQAAEKSLTDTTLKANEDALESYVRRTQGEMAARRVQIAFERDQQIADIRISGDTEEKKAAAIKAVRARSAQELATLNDAEQDRIIKARAENEARVAKITESTQIAASKEAADKAEAGNTEQRAKRLISERQFIHAREQLELEAIGREEHARGESIDRQIAAHQKLLDATTDPEKRTQISGTITALQDQRNAIVASAKQQSAQVIGQATADTAKLTRALGDAINEAMAETLQAQGQIVEAASRRIHKQFDDLIREAEQANDQIGANALRAQRDVELQRAQIQQFDRDASRVTTASENQIARVNALLSVHGITTANARTQIVAALEAERAAIEKSVAGLEAMDAATPGNPETLDKIDAYKTKIAELNALIAKTSDPLFALKETARGATTDALSGFFDGLAHLGQQDRSQIRALTTDLQSAQAELNELLAIPAAERSGEVNTRISQLRGEIAQTTASLDEAKASITSWRDLFVSALQSIADALVRVSSQMLATALIERVLGIVVGSSISGPSQTLSGDTLGAGAGKVFGATGGLFVGPGTGTSDSIDARVSTGEMLINAERTKRYYPLLHAINFDPDPPEVVLPRAVRHYASGGYVAPPATSPSALTRRGALDRMLVTVDRGLVAMYVKDVMRGRDGREIVVKHVQENGRELGLR